MNELCCNTKYPILLVHGAGFRDFKWPNYWGRIPSVLKENGAAIYYANQDGWSTIQSSAAAILSKIGEIQAETDCEKVNIIAHSKGGLDARMAASSLHGHNRIASITTIGTPHAGSKTVDMLLKHLHPLLPLGAFFVNNWMRILGDQKPDFLKACQEFSTEHMEKFNADNPDHPDVYYQSFAGRMKTPFSDINLSTANFVVDLMEGANDGLVTVASACRYEPKHILVSNSNRGISHLDEIDFRRMPLTQKKGNNLSDICDLYIDIAANLKNRGL